MYTKIPTPTPIPTPTSKPAPGRTIQQDLHSATLRINRLKLEVNRKELKMQCYKQYSRLLEQACGLASNVTAPAWEHAVNLAWDKMRAAGIDIVSLRKPKVYIKDNT